jgi:hypothetical protein
MDRVEDGVGPDDAQIGVLLSGEAGEGKIFGGRRGPDRHHSPQVQIGGDHRIGHVPRHGARRASSADRSRSSGARTANWSTRSLRSAAAVTSR